MKKLFVLPIVALFIGTGVLVSKEITSNPVYAEGVESEVVEESILEEITSEEELTEEELTKEGFINQTKAFLSKYLDEQLVMSIINWAIDVGLLTALFGVYLKYRKYKAKSSKEIAEEVKNTVDKAVKETVDKLTTEQLQGIYKVVEKINMGLITTNKALVLAQDKTAEGKTALLNLIAEKSDDESVKETAKSVKDKIDEEEQIREEVNQQVSDEYKGIF